MGQNCGQNPPNVYRSTGMDRISTVIKSYISKMEQDRALVTIECG